MPFLSRTGCFAIELTMISSRSRLCRPRSESGRWRMRRMACASSREIARRTVVMGRPVSSAIRAGVAPAASIGAMMARTARLARGARGSVDFRPQGAGKSSTCSVISPSSGWIKT